MEPLVQAWPAEEVSARRNHGLFSCVKTDIALKAGAASAVPILLASTHSCYHLAIAIEILPP
jgi:hypothetical protein